jgi:hypothetical protein
MQTIPFQYELRPEIPNVYGALDYREFRGILIKLESLIAYSVLDLRIAVYSNGLLA